MSSDDFCNPDKHLDQTEWETQVEEREVVLLLDIAACHPETLNNHFSKQNSS